jgi:hypothetical protein
MMRKLLLAATALLALTGAARGEEPKLFATTAGDWKIYSYQDRCGTSDTFKNGTVLSFGVDTSGTSWIRVMSEQWNIPLGVYQVEGGIDDDNSFAWNFEADKGGKGIVANFEMDQAAFNAFTKGNVLRLKIGSTVYGYSLTGTSALFPKLLECIKQVATASNPFSGQKPVAPVSTPSNPFRPV